METTLIVKRMSCENCKKKIINALKGIKGVIEVSANLEEKKVIIQHSKLVSAEVLKKVIEEKQCKKKDNVVLS